MNIDDSNPRPQKRLRTDHSPDVQRSYRPPPSSSPLSVPPTSSQPSSTLRPLPPQILLLALPALLAHPPSHEHYPLSLFLSLRALRTCLELKALTPDIECRAWTSLAEVGLRVINSGFSASVEHEWARGIDSEVKSISHESSHFSWLTPPEVENAIGKGLLIAQKHPSLRPLRHQLSLLNAQFAFQTNNTKYARALLRRLIASFVTSDPPSIVYTAHLALITHLTSTPQTAHGECASTSAAELQAALTTITTLSTLAAQNRHWAIADLAAVLRVRVLVAAGMWDHVGDALSAAEGAMHMVFHTQEEKSGRATNGENAKSDTAQALMRSYSITAQDVNDSSASQSQSQSSSVGPHSGPVTPPPIPTPKAQDPLTLSLTAHILILGIIYHTHAGRARSADYRLAALHSLMDSGALVGGANADGLVEVPIPGYDSIHLRVTHPRVMFLLTFLVSAACKRDPVSRRPKKRVFAECGAAQCREGRAEGSPAINGGVHSFIAGPLVPRLTLACNFSASVPSWASHDDVKDIEQHTLRIEADLLCELVVVSIQRSDFAAAESHLTTLVAFARTHDFFDAYSPRITLLHAHLAHALGDTNRAETCYRVAAHLDGAPPVGSGVRGGGFVAAAARAGEALLRIGLSAAQTPAPSNTPTSNHSDATPQFDPATTALVKDAMARCSSPGSSCPLPALGDLVSSALSHSHILRSKSLLKHALELSSLAGDNHLRALVLAVVGAQYVYTAPAHAMEVLAVCETLGAGMGASPRKEGGEEVKATADVPTTATATASGPDGISVDGIGNAPLRLWVGEKFLELFKRAGKDNRVRKQEAFNAVYQSAVNDLAIHRARLW